MTDSTEETTDADVAAAADAAREAEKLALSLEAQVAAGDDTVTMDQLEARRAESRFAVLRLQGVRTKLAQAKEARRQAQAKALRAEVDAYAPGVGKKLAAALRKVAAAEDAFVALADEHDQQVSEWGRRASRLEIPEHDGRPVPPAEHAGLAIPKGGGLLRAGRRTLATVGGKSTLDSYRSKVHLENPNLTHGATVADGWKSDRDLFIDAIAQTDAEAPEPSPSTRYFLGRGGAVIAMDRDMTDNERNAGLVEISAEEAFGA